MLPGRFALYFAIFYLKYFIANAKKPILNFPETCLMDGPNSIPVSKTKQNQHSFDDTDEISISSMPIDILDTSKNSTAHGPQNEDEMSKNISQQMIPSSSAVVVYLFNIGQFGIHFLILKFSYLLFQ